MIIKPESLTIYVNKLENDYAKIATVKQSLESGAKSIGALVNAYDVKRIAALIKLELIKLNEILDLKRPLKEHAIDLIADEIVSTYGNLSLADVALIFRRARRGDYGQFYESINMPKVIGWFKDYFDERCEVAAAISQRQAQQHNSGFGKRTGDGRKELKEVMRKANAAYLTGKL